MDPEYNLQDVLRCHLCETPGPDLHCDICKTYLCNACEKTHLADESKEHKVVSFKLRRQSTLCKKHFSKLCECYCKKCNILICNICASSRKHRRHEIFDAATYLEQRKAIIRKDLQELEHSIFPKYQEIAHNIQMQKDNMNDNSQKLRSAIEKQRKDLHKVIDTIIEKMKLNINKAESQHRTALKLEKPKIERSIDDIKTNIDDLNKLLKSNDFRLFSTYKSKNADFRRIPKQFSFVLQSFTPQVLNKEQIHHQFGSLSEFSIKKEKYSNTAESQDKSAELSPLAVQLLDIPRIITDINTKYRGLLSVSSLSDDDIWACGQDKIIKLYNLQGKIVKSIQTKSGNNPWDITVTRNGDLVYTSVSDRTVNIVNNEGMHTEIKVKGWSPLNICSSSSGDLLVVMYSDDKETKVVRYSGQIERQTIQYDGKGRPLYSSYFYTKYISENRNLDICVSDSAAGAVVVVNQVGKLRFIYTGPSATTKEPFYPIGIATDSQRRLLIADYKNYCIHLVNQDGHFLCHIDNLHLQRPFGLCMDTRDNLYVAEYLTGKVKKIQCYK